MQRQAMTAPVRVRDERGASSVVETVLVAPALLLTLMLIVQFGLYFHAANVAENAAQEGAAAGRQFDGSQAGAEERARRFLAGLGPRMFSNRKVTATRTPENATVTVTGAVISLVPGLDLTVEESASGPVERYVPPAAQVAHP
jgi:Flp pilus assembly protein TadG